MSASRHLYRGFRFPAEIIAHAVWLYRCFSLSLRDVELILAARGVTVSYEHPGLGYPFWPAIRRHTQAASIKTWR
jgi:hypothetical protein